MTPVTTETVVDILAEVLEKQAFMFGDACEIEELVPETEEFLYGTIGFEGPAEGEMAMVVPVTFGQELAANLLGVDADDVEDADALDSAGELLNVAVGHLLTSLHGHEAAFSLTMPSVSPAGQGTWEQFTGRRSAVGLMVDEHPMAVSVSFRVVAP